MEINIGKVSRRSILVPWSSHHFENIGRCVHATHALINMHVPNSACIHTEFDRDDAPHRVSTSISDMKCLESRMVHHIHKCQVASLNCGIKLYGTMHALSRLDIFYTEHDQMRIRKRYDRYPEDASRTLAMPPLRTSYRNPGLSLLRHLSTASGR